MRKASRTPAPPYTGKARKQRLARQEAAPNPPWLRVRTAHLLVQQLTLVQLLPGGLTPQTSKGFGKTFPKHYRVGSDSAASDPPPETRAVR